MRTLIAIIFGIVAIWSAILGQGCWSTVRNDVYILPPTEFATTQAYPDVITLENELVRIFIIPNRGRIMADYFYKPTGHSELYHNYVPLPMLQDHRYFYEFGGYYASLPWNVRDNQPDELSYELIRGESDRCAVKLWGKDFTTGLILTTYVEIRPESPVVNIALEISNPEEEEVTIRFYDLFIALPGGEISKETELLIPVDHILLGPSENDWMGRQGVEIPWPQPWKEWGRFRGKGEFRVVVANMRKAQLAVYNPVLNESFVKSWSPLTLYEFITISSWGPKYKDVLGAFPGFSIKSEVNLKVAPGETLMFHASFRATKGLPCP